MNSILIFGATGMVGQGVLRESLLDESITRVTVIGRTSIRQIANQTVSPLHSKLHEIIHADLFDYSEIESQLAGFDACFFCLGTTSAGKSESEYSRITKDLTLVAADVLLKLNAKLTFVYVSAEGADSTETSRLMWARVRGRTENELLRRSFAKIFIVRPGVIQPLNGIQSKTDAYRIGYVLLKPVLPILRRLLPHQVTSTELLAKAMLKIARDGYPKAILTNADVHAISQLT